MDEESIQDLPPQPPKSKKVFINCVDTYQGSNLAKHLSQCVVGSSEEDPEDAEEEEEEIEEADEKKFVQKEGAYEIVGTLRNKDQPKADYVKEIITYDTKDVLYNQLMQCDIVIYDITENADQIDDACWAVSQMHSDLDKINKENPKMFILISTVLTWTHTKVDDDDPEIPFTEEDYRRRKPHKDFKEHISVEKQVIKLGKTSKNKFSTYVVASGITYGSGESMFHYLFKSAWHNAAELLYFDNDLQKVAPEKIVGPGKNIVPTIHIRDLAAIIQNIADSRPKVRYIVAVDESKNNLVEITKAVSKALTTGKVRKQALSEALLVKDFKENDLHSLTVNLRMTAVFVRDSMNIRWVSEAGLVENIDAIVKDYKRIRGLQPIRVMVYGPPASGKTTVVQQLCSHFKLHHVKIKDVIEEAVNKMTKFLEERKRVEALAQAESDEQDEEEEEEEEEDVNERTVEYRELLETLTENQEANGGRLEDQHIVKLMRDKLLSKPCQNQGFIIDGFPRSINGPNGQELAREIFASLEEGENDDGTNVTYDKSLMPELIVSLEATDEFIRERVINLPEVAVIGTHNTEEGLNRRLAEYRRTNTDDETVLNYFDVLENHPKKIDITTDSSLKMKDTVDKIIKLIKGPRNYGPTDEEQKEINRVALETKLKREEQERVERESQEVEEAALRKKRQEEWTKRLEEVKREEHELLENKSAPLRNYLMRHVMPTLTQGLVECCKVRPEDAIDYLAEYLFKNNPQVD